VTAPLTLGTAGPRVLVETSHDLPLVSISIASKAGALFDPPNAEGTTRLTARLMRRTGGGRDPQAMDTMIDSLGGSFGADVSASAVAFQGTVIRRSLPAFIELVIDVLARPGLGADELGRLARETEAELIEALDDDRGLVRRWFRKKLFEDHPYGRAVSGTATTLRGVTPEVVSARARGIAGRDGLVFALAGDIDAAEANALVERITSALPAGGESVDPTPHPTMPSGRRLVVVDKPERTQTQILIGGLGTHPLDPDHTALLVGNTIFGGTFTARLTQEVRSKRGWSYGAYSSLPIDRRRQAFNMWTFPKADDAAACIELELELLSTLREHGVTKKELSWAKRYLMRSHAFAIDTASKRVGLALDQLLYDLPAGYYDDYLERLSAVTLDQVNAALTARLPDRDLLLVVVGTAADLRAPIEKVVPDLTSTEVVRFDAEAS